MPPALPYAALLEARPGDPFLTWEVVPDGVEYAAGIGGSVVLVAPSAYHGKRWLTGLGAAPEVAVLTEAALAAPTGNVVAGLSLPEDVLAGLPARLRPQRVERWAWWWAERPHASMADPSVMPLAAHDDRLTPLLRQSSSVYLRPGDARVEVWYGLVEHGALLGCLAVERHHPAVPHLASVVVDGAARGRGVGTRLCGTVVNRLLASGAPVVSLAMMQDNEAAAALYRRLGFQRAADFTSGTIPGRRGSPPVAGWQPGGART